MIRSNGIATRSLASFTVTVRGSIEQPDAEGLFQVVEIRDGTIVAIRDFIHRDDAMAAAGL
jgi:hypothetical protein